MPTVREILQQSGVDEYTINSIDQSVMTGFQNVLTEAENQKTSVDDFLEKYLFARHCAMGSGAD